MSEALRTSPQLTLWEWVSATSSPASPDGATRCDSPESPTMPASGPDHVRVKGSAKRAAVADSPTPATSGPSGSDSSPSAALQSSLESNLRARLASSGSTLFSLTWKERATPAQRRICALRASALRTADSGCSSWPTPVVSRGDYSRRNGNPDEQTLKLSGVAKLASWPTPTVADGTASRDTFHHGENNPTLLGAARRAAWATPQAHDSATPKTPEQIAAARAAAPKRSSGGPPGFSNLNEQAQLSPWPTPRAVDGAKGSTADNPGRSEGPDLPTVAGRSPWPTPASRDRKSSASNKHGDNSRPLNEVARLTGEAATGSPAPTASRGQLNPEHTRFLMGFPAGWGSCADTATRSSRK